MEIILITLGVLTAVGLLVGLGLVFTGRKFHVDVDEKEQAVRAELPGNNCGACGFAGCDALAAAIAKGEAPVNSCPVGGRRSPLSCARAAATSRRTRATISASRTAARPCFQA